jgi:hypothetical protein
VRSKNYEGYRKAILFRIPVSSSVLGKNIPFKIPIFRYLQSTFFPWDEIPIETHIEGLKGGWVDLVVSQIK